MNYKKYINSQLCDIYDKHEIQTLLYIILERLTGKSKLELLTCKYNQLSINDDTIFKEIIHNLKKNKPLQYIFGDAQFYGLTFKINNKVLIPRPETEELVSWIINQENIDKENILDIGTGSGCIAISLAKNLINAKLSAIDISNDALSLARKNAENNNVKIDFYNMNIIDEKTWLKNKFDIIVSNPPYICEKEKININKNVLEYEPHIALFVPDQKPLIFYDKIADFAIKMLNNNGKLFFEINPIYNNELLYMLKHKGFKNIVLKKDLSGKIRMAMAIR